MPGFDRSKLKTTTNAALHKQQREQEQKRPKNKFTKGSTHKIEDGDNLFRIYPPHPVEGLADDEVRYAEAKCVSFLEVEKPKRDQDTGRVIEGETEIKGFPIFNARVHGNFSKDPVEEYMKFAKEVAIPNYTGDPADVKTPTSPEAKKIWSIITGYNGPDGKFVSGIKPQDSWVVYADKFIEGEWKLGLLEFKTTVKEGLKNLALTLTNGESPDPYTSPEDGYVIRINKVGKGLNTKYTVFVHEKQINKVDSKKIILPLTDEQLDAWFKLPSLRNTFVGSYRRTELEFQLEGLKRFDDKLTEKKLPIKVFGYDDFLDVLEEISNEVPDVASKGEEPAKQQPAKQQVVAKKVEPAKPVQTITRKQPVKQVVAEPVIEDEEDQVQREMAEEQEETQVVETTTRPSGRDRLAEIRARHAKKA